MKIISLFASSTRMAKSGFKFWRCHAGIRKGVRSEPRTIVSEKGNESWEESCLVKFSDFISNVETVFKEVSSIGD